MGVAEKYQRQLLQQSQHIYAGTPITAATAAAYLATPRHRFVTRYREWGSPQWHDVREDNLGEHLGTLYSNRPLPSFVLRMLDMLRLAPGHRVLELGAGSGWNAAMLGRLTEPGGHVWSVEIVPALAGAATEAVGRAGPANVSIVEGDGGDGHAPAAPYDRVIFTAGAYDLPRPFHTHVKEGGLMLAVIKSEGGGDTLFLLQKTGACFASLEGMPCGFVQLRGRHRVDSLAPIPVEELPGWSELAARPLSRTPFWWGGKGRESTPWRTLGIRSFLGIAEPGFRPFKIPRSAAHPREEHYFGLWLPTERSLVLAQDDHLIAYGTEAAKTRLLDRIRQWVDLGMPTAASFALRIYPSDAAVAPGDHEWRVVRKDSTFLWSLPAGRVT